MSELYVLYKDAAGYGMFKVEEIDKNGTIQSQVEAAVTDSASFNSIVKLVSFSPFKNFVGALQSMITISDDKISDALLKFIKKTIPEKKNTKLGFANRKLSTAIAELMDLQCSHLGDVPEIIRGIRCHFHDLTKGFTAQSAAVAQHGLGHSYSRSKVKLNRVYTMISQSIALLNQLDKDINTFAMRIREWYSYHFPELIEIIPDNYTFARCAKFIKNRKDLSDASLDGLKEITEDSGKAQAIIDASKSSMGMDSGSLDRLNVELFAGQVISLADYRKELAQYLKINVVDTATNLATRVGEQVAAQLIAHAGALTNLAKHPPTSVQILGTEKALLKSLKNRENTPKYGLRYHSTFIGGSVAENKRYNSRYSSNECSIATRIDSFVETQTKMFGEMLRQQVTDQVKDVMKDAVDVEQGANKSVEKKKKKKKKKKKRKSEIEEVSISEIEIRDETEVDDEDETPKKKKKKTKMQIDV